jgi:hypothetical protein
MIVAFISVQVSDFAGIADLPGEADGKLQRDILILGSVMQLQRSRKIGKIRIG